MRIAMDFRAGQKQRHRPSATTTLDANLNLKPYIIKSLWTGAALLVVMLVAACLAVLLSAVGDGVGAKGALGVALVVLACSMLNFVCLVVLIALSTVNSTGSSTDASEDTDPVSSDLTGRDEEV